MTFLSIILLYLSLVYCSIIGQLSYIVKISVLGLAMFRVINVT